MKDFTIAKKADPEVYVAQIKAIMERKPNYIDAIRTQDIDSSEITQIVYPEGVIEVYYNVFTGSVYVKTNMEIEDLLIAEPLSVKST